MTSLSIGIALVALIAIAAVWLRLQTIEKTVEQLEQRHEASQTTKTVDLEGLSLPPFRFPDKVFEPPEKLVILGYRSLTIDLGNQPDGNEHGVIKNVTIDTPLGTTHVVASLKGFFLTFGAVIRNSDGDIVALSADDHHLGYEAVDISVVEVLTGKATLKAAGVLRDDNGDDRWSGTLVVSLLFLGPQS